MTQQPDTGPMPNSSKILHMQNASHSHCRRSRQLLQLVLDLRIPLKAALNRDADTEQHPHGRHGAQQEGEAADAHGGVRGGRGGLQGGRARHHPGPPQLSGRHPRLPTGWQLEPSRGARGRCRKVCTSLLPSVILLSIYW